MHTFNQIYEFRGYFGLYFTVERLNYQNDVLKLNIMCINAILHGGDETTTVTTTNPTTTTTIPTTVTPTTQMTTTEGTTTAGTTGTIVYIDNFTRHHHNSHSSNNCSMKCL